MAVREPGFSTPTVGHQQLDCDFPPFRSVDAFYSSAHRECSPRVASVVIGGVITWLVAYWYYQRAAKGLDLEAAKLRNLMRIVLVVMEQQGWAKLNRDGSGNIVGFEVEKEFAGQLKFQGSLDIKHIRGTGESSPFVG